MRTVWRRLATLLYAVFFVSDLTHIPLALKKDDGGEALLYVVLALLLFVFFLFSLNDVTRKKGPDA